MSRRAEYILTASSAQRQGTPRGDVLTKSWRLGRSFAAQTHVLAAVAPPAPTAQSLGASAWPLASMPLYQHVRTFLIAVPRPAPPLSTVRLMTRFVRVHRGIR
jgi:hypothetical protein